MWQIPGEAIWLGHAGDLRNMTVVLAAGIAAVSDPAANEPVPRLPRDLTYCRFPLVDGAGNAPELLRLSVETVTALLRSQLPTLVCCSVGLSRSPAVVAAALAVRHGIGPEEGLRR